MSHVWIVAPEHRTLEVMRRTDDGWLLEGAHRETDIVRAEPFDAIELDLSLLRADFADGPPSAQL